MFSARVSADLTPNRLSQAVARRRAEGRAFIDLTGSNPTTAGIRYPPTLLDALSDRRGLVYAPAPLGLIDARRAVADDYARRGLDVSPERVVLTASTSEAYSILFKLLCEPGDEVLLPRPSYPLFEHLTRLDDINGRFYDLDFHAAWAVDIASVERALTPRTRALLIVSPNNPTGSIAKADELDTLASLCVARDVAIIADEVFADYELAPGPSCQRGHLVAAARGLAFSLGGLSKSIGLPQVKLGWIVVSGSEENVSGALARLELVCDTYLSVSTPVQIAAHALLDHGTAVRDEIQQRVRHNYHHAVQRLRGTACRALPAEGGWYAVLSVPTLGSEEDLVLELLDRCDVVAHPGYFFDFPRESFLIASLLGPEDEFGDGIERIAKHFDCRT
jgi:alanine-synthesizing transaminase